jgi:hypothetical protein
MKTVDDWCCGSPCPTYFNSLNGSMSVAGKSFCSASHEIRIEFPDGVNARVTGGSGLACGSNTYVLDQKTNDIFITSSSGSTKEACLSGSFQQAGLTDAPETIVYMPHGEKLSLMTQQKQQVILTKC